MEYTIPLRTDGARAVARIHNRWLKLIQSASPRTLRRTCLEIAALEEMNRDYVDGILFQVLRKNLEGVIRNLGGPRCQWSVERSRRDLRGRTRRKPKKIHLNRDVQQKLKTRLSLIDEAEDR